MPWSPSSETTLASRGFYQRITPALDSTSIVLENLIDLIATITLIAASAGEKTHRSVDLLGRVYEYFLTRFASAEGKNGGQFYTPSCVVRCLVEMLALPGQLFYSTQIPVCLWFLTKSKKADAKRGYRDRRKQTLFIDARKLGTLIDRVHLELTDADLQKITSIYHAWRSGVSTDNRKLKTENSTAAYADGAGFCKSATNAEIAAHGHVLTPGRYVGAEEVEDDGDPFEEKMPRLVAELHAQFAESAKLEKLIRKNLKGLGYGG